MASRSAPSPVDPAVAEPTETRYVLHLYITGMSQRSSRAIANVLALCDAHFRDRYDLEVIDIYQQPERIPRDHTVTASPMLIKVLPLPVVRIYGDLENSDAALLALELKALR